MALRVLLADDHRVVCHGLQVLLSRNHILVIGEASDGQEAVEMAQRLHPDVAVLDLSMPVLNGLSAAHEIARTTDTKTILLTMHSDPHYVISALRAGIRGYVLKNKAASGLIEAIGEVCQGNIYLSPSISRTVVEAFLTMPNLNSDPLTARERQVVQLIAEGRTTKEVANSLGLSVKTAESHRSRIMEKLGVHETAGLVLYAIRNGIIQP